jgi:hypothetical protein
MRWATKSPFCFSETRLNFSQIVCSAVICRLSVGRSLQLANVLAFSRNGKLSFAISFIYDSACTLCSLPTSNQALRDHEQISDGAFETYATYRLPWTFKFANMFIACASRTGWQVHPFFLRTFLNDRCSIHLLFSEPAAWNCQLGQGS